MLRKVKDVSLNPSIKGSISDTISKSHIILKLKSFNYLDNAKIQILNNIEKTDVFSITRVTYNVFRVTLELYYILRSINDPSKRIMGLNPYHYLNYDDGLFLKINLQGIVDYTFTKQEKENIGITQFIVESVIQSSGHIVIELGTEEVPIDNLWVYAYDTPVIPLVYNYIYHDSQNVSGINLYNSDRTVKVLQSDKEIDYLNSVIISVNTLVTLKDECLTEKKLRSFWFKNTPKIININKFRGNYSKITNIDSNYMSYPLINKNNLRREVA